MKHVTTATLIVLITTLGWMGCQSDSGTTTPTNSVTVIDTTTKIDTSVKTGGSNPPAINRGLFNIKRTVTPIAPESAWIYKGLKVADLAGKWNLKSRVTKITNDSAHLDSVQTFDTTYSFTLIEPDSLVLHWPAELNLRVAPTRLPTDTANRPVTQPGTGRPSRNITAQTDACKTKAVGDSCSYTFNTRTQSGTCQEVDTLKVCRATITGIPGGQGGAGFNGGVRNGHFSLQDGILDFKIPRDTVAYYVQAFDDTVWLTHAIRTVITDSTGKVLSTENRVIRSRCER